MCGILGVFSRKSIPPGRSIQCAAGLEMLKHRGPDHSKLKAFSHAILGYTRLSIIDPSPKSNQPFADPLGRWWIVWNGEIYNYKELRYDLEALGHSFSTLSDTEVLLEAYKEWGEECLGRLNGMWALSIFDLKERTLFLSRDRYGIKPLYWAEDNSGLFFASEMKVFVSLGFSLEPNWKEISHYLQEGFVSEAGDSTVFSNIHSLPPGHSLSVSLRSSRKISRWYTIRDNLINNVPRRFEERTERFRYLLEDSVRLRVRNDVPTAVTLSGGVDSSSIYGACHRLQREGKLSSASDINKKKELRSCSVIYPDHSIDEYPWIEKCLEHWNGQDDFMPVTPAATSIPLLIDEMIWFQEAPVWSPAIMSFHSLYKHVSNAGIRVVLEGHGADEMLGGYEVLVKAALVEYLSKAKYLKAWNASQCLNDMHSSPTLIKRLARLRALKRSLITFFSMAREGNRSLYSLSWGYSPPQLKQYFSREIIEAWSPEENSNSNKNCFEDALYASFTKRALPFFLRVFDRATMAYGVESCTPFLDHRLVQFVFSLPPTDKVDRVSKKILRAAGKVWLPNAIINRTVKMPFTAPIVEWFNSKVVRAYLLDTFNSADALSASCINARDMADFVHSKGQNDFSYSDVQLLWPVLNLYLWERTFCRG